MNGAVFLTLKNMIIESHDEAAWQTLVTRVAPECGGNYEANKSYPDSEAVAYIGAVAELLNSSISDVTEVFGQYLFSALNRMSPSYTAAAGSLFEFLQTIEPVIHREIRAGSAKNSLPVITVRKLSDGSLLMRYTSPRKLCFLAEGLIRGASKHYDEAIELTHAKCLHRGDYCCELGIKLTGSS